MRTESQSTGLSGRIGTERMDKGAKDGMVIKGTALQEEANRANVSKRDQFWDQFRGGGSSVLFPTGKSPLQVLCKHTRPRCCIRNYCTPVPS